VFIYFEFAFLNFGLALKQEGGNLSDQPSRSTVHQNNRRHSESFFLEGARF
jgi:hypothetical protein